MLEGLAAKFMPMDGRFLADKTAYGSASAKKPTGESTVAEYKCKWSPCSPAREQVKESHSNTAGDSTSLFAKYNCTYKTNSST